jgi:hypothetical protein
LLDDAIRRDDPDLLEVLRGRHQAEAELPGLREEADEAQGHEVLKLVDIEVEVAAG